MPVGLRPAWLNDYFIGKQDIIMEENHYYYEDPDPDFYTQQPDPPVRTQSDGLATASLVLGICSLIFICCGGSFVVGALGIILALLSRGSSSMSGNAKAGLILSIIGFVLSSVIYGVMFVSMIVSGELKDMIEDYQYYYDYGNDLDDFDTDDIDIDDLLDQYQDGGEL